MNKINEIIREKLIIDNYSLFYIMLYGCGGIMFQCHFYDILGKRDTSLLQRLIDYRLVKVKRIGKNHIIVMKYAVFCYFGLENKSIKLTAHRLLHSAQFGEMVRHATPDKTERMLKASNFAYFSPRNSYYILNRVDTFLSERGIGDLTSLQAHKERLKQKIRFIEQSRIGNKDYLDNTLVKGDDLLTLKCNEGYIKSVDYCDKLQVKVCLFATGKTADKIVRALTKAEEAIGAMFYGIDTEIYYEICSLSAKSETLEAKVIKAMDKRGGFRMTSYSESIKFHWYDVKQKLFSGIDIDKWL